MKTRLGRAISTTIVLTAVIVICLLIPAAANASGDITISITDPTRQGVQVYEGNTVNNALSVPVITYGDDRTLGTLRVTGKAGISVPVREGNQVKVELPLGLCYMTTPTEDNYKNYVDYPDSVDGLTNQIRDGSGKPGLRFIAGSPRSITVLVNNVDKGRQTMAIDFIFNKTGISTVRVSPLLDAARTYMKDSEGKVTRLEYLKLLADVVIRLDPGLLDIAADEKDISSVFADGAQISPEDRSRIQLLVNSGLIAGYPNKMLKPGEFLTRAEAISLLVRTMCFPAASFQYSFKDAVPAWASRDINAAVAGGIAAGQADGTFGANRKITKAEVVSLMQRTIEKYKSK